MTTNNYVVQRDGDWNIVQAELKTGHFPGAIPSSHANGAFLILILLFLIVWKKQTA